MLAELDASILVLLSPFSSGMLLLLGDFGVSFSSSVAAAVGWTTTAVAGIFVRELNDNAASAWYGAVWGTGINGIKTPGGNPGERIRMYHPRLGRWIVQQMVLVWLCYKKILLFWKKKKNNIVNETRCRIMLTTRFSMISSSPRNLSFREKGYTNQSKKSSGRRSCLFCTYLVPNHFLWTF